MENEKESYLQLFRRYIHIFTLDYKELHQVSWVENSIELVDGAKPIKKMPYRMNPNFSKTVKEEINKLLDAGFIFTVENSERVSPIVISIKKNGKLRIFVDYRKLNKATKKDHYPLPFSDQILDEVAGQECYSFTDGYSGYNQVHITEKDNLNTMFTTPWGTFAYRVMPFGLFEPYIGNFIRVFLDDFYIYGSKMDHLHQMETTFQRLDEAQASLNPKKCVFGCSKGVLLGHVVFRDGIGTDPDKVSKIKELPFPMNRSKLRSFLGHVGYYKRFIKNFSNITHPLTQFLKKDVTYEPGNKAHEAFEQLKEALVSSPVLKNPDWSKPFIVYTDASDAALGSTLSQKDENGNDHPVYFGSRQMSSAEVNYTVTEKEALAIIFAINKFRNYLLG
ncbi:hypothetical protein KI387_029266, partial [Taxus chinensis]